MTSENLYIKALRQGAAPHELHVLELQIIEDASTDRLIELLNTEIAELTGKRARLHQLTLANVRLATTLAARSQNDTSKIALNAAIDAARIWWRTLNDAEKAKRMQLRALWLAGIHFPETLEDSINAANGPQAALHLLRQTIQNGHELAMDFSHILLDILKNHGAPKKILLEALKALRKWPHNAAFHLKVRSYAELTQKAEEALFPLKDLLEKHPNDPTITSLVLESIGKMHQILQDDESAFSAYQQALKCNPNRSLAWQYGQQLSEKLNLPFDFPKPPDATLTEGMAVTMSPQRSEEETVRSRNMLSQESTSPGNSFSASLHSLEEQDILELHSVPPSLSPPPLPQDSEEQPPVLPEPDQHDDFDHIWQAERQRLSMDAESVSEARPIKDNPGTATLVSVPSWEMSESDTSFEEETEVQRAELSETSTQVGFFRKGNNHKQPASVTSSEESDIDDTPDNTQFELAIDATGTQLAYDLLRDQEPQQISAIWRHKLFQKLMEQDKQHHNLLSLHPQVLALLQEGFADVVKWVTIYFSRLNEADRSSVPDLWVKTLELLDEDHPLDGKLTPLILKAAAAQSSLTEKVYALADNCHEPTLKRKIFKSILPLWPHEEGVNQTYAKLARNTEAFPSEHFEICEEWAETCPDTIDAQKALLRAAQQHGKPQHAKKALERLLGLVESPIEKAAQWSALAEHYWLQSPDYWKEAATACVQAIGYEPNNLDHWVAFILKCEDKLGVNEAQAAHALLSNPNEALLSELRQFLDPILLDLGDDHELLPPELRKIIGLLLGMNPKDPAKACEILSSMVDDFSDDLSILETYAHLLAIHGLKPKPTPLNHLETILSSHAEAIDTMQQLSLWGDLGTVRWSAGDSSGALSAFQKLFGLLQHDADNPSPAIPERVLDTAFSVLNSPEHKEDHTGLLIATLELKAQHQSKMESASSLKRALALASKHDAAKAKSIFEQLPLDLLDASTLESGRKTYDNLDQLDGFCAHLRERLKGATTGSPIRTLLLEQVADIEGQLLRGPATPASASARIEPVSKTATRHEQAAALLMDAKEYDKAINAIRQCIVQDIRSTTSWQKLFVCAQKTENDWLLLQAGAGLVAMNLATAELTEIFANREMVGPQLPASLPTAERVNRLITHPLHANQAEPLLTELSLTIPKIFGKPLNELGLEQQNQLRPRDLSDTWQQSLQTVYQLLHFENKLSLFENHQPMAIDAILAPTFPPSLVVEPKSRTENISLQSVFFMARALYWAQPQTQLLTLLRLDELRGVITALGAFLLRQAPPSSAQAALRMGQKLTNVYLKSGPKNEREKRQESLANKVKQLRDHDIRKEAQKHFQATSLSSNRLALLLTGDLLTAISSLALLHQRPVQQGNSLAIRDLLGFGISDGLQKTRAQMGMVCDPILISKLYQVSRLG